MWPWYQVGKTSLWQTKYTKRFFHSKNTLGRRICYKIVAISPYFLSHPILLRFIPNKLCGQDRRTLASSYICLPILLQAFVTLGMSHWQSASPMLDLQRCWIRILFCPLTVTHSIAAYTVSTTEHFANPRIAPQHTFRLVLSFADWVSFSVGLADRISRERTLNVRIW